MLLYFIAHNSGQSGCNGAALIRAKQLFQTYVGLFVAHVRHCRRLPQKFTSILALDDFCLLYEFFGFS